MNTHSSIIESLQKFDIPYEEFEHEPIVTYDDALREAKNFGWTGIESKNVFLKGKSESFYMYVTTMGNKVDFKQLKELLGEKVSIATPEELKEHTGCVPGCACPFGFQKSIMILVEEKIFENDLYLFSPGVPTKTIQCSISCLKPVFENLENKVVWIN